MVNVMRKPVPPCQLLNGEPIINIPNSNHQRQCMKVDVSPDQIRKGKKSIKKNSDENIEGLMQMDCEKINSLPNVPVVCLSN